MEYSVEVSEFMYTTADGDIVPVSKLSTFLIIDELSLMEQSGITGCEAYSLLTDELMTRLPADMLE